jgi:hypothetical protein
MAKTRRAYCEENSSQRIAPPGETVVRCGWCGMVMLEEEQAVQQQTELCSECVVILRHVDWRKLVDSKE